MDLIERLRAVHMLAADNACRDTDRRGICGDILKHDGACGNLAVIAHGDRTEYLGARADHDIVADGRVTFSLVLAGASERCALINGAVIADDGRFADNDGAAVVDKQPFTDDCRGVYFDPGGIARGLAARAAKNIPFL